MKEGIATLLALVAFTALVLLIIGFFSPRTALFWYRKPRTKKSSALVYGLTFLATLILFGLVSPPPKDAAAAKEPASDKEPTAQTAATEDTVSYQVANEEKEGDRVYLALTIDKIYDQPALIEATRRLKEQYQAHDLFRCYYYYKKYTKLTTAVAGVIYLPDCSQCAFKDKDGNPVDFPCYNVRRSAADSLKAMHFDTAGYKQEVNFMEAIGGAKRMIFSSASNKALYVEQDLDGHTVTPLIKKVVDGKDRYCLAEDTHKYYVINKQDGLVEYYSYGELDSQDAIDN